MKIDDVQVYDTVTFDVHNDGVEMEQKLWPRHCVIDSWGSEFHQDLKVSQLFFLSKVFFSILTLQRNGVRSLLDLVFYEGLQGKRILLHSYKFCSYVTLLNILQYICLLDLFPNLT